jgi:hypothetical protein
MAIGTAFVAFAVSYVRSRPLVFNESLWCHAHYLWSGFVREVCFVDGGWRTVPVGQWPTFARDQGELLVAAGCSRAQAQQLYDQVR